MSCVCGVVALSAATGNSVCVYIVFRSADTGQKRACWTTPMVMTKNTRGGGGGGGVVGVGGCSSSSRVVEEAEV